MTTWARSLRIGEWVWAPDEQGRFDEQVFPLLSTGVPSPPEVTVQVLSTPGQIGGKVPDVRGWGPGKWSIRFLVTDRDPAGEHKGSAQLAANRAHLFDILVTTRGLTRIEIEEAYDSRRPSTARPIRVADAAYAGLALADSDYDTEEWEASWIIPSGIWKSRDFADQLWTIADSRPQRLVMDLLDTLPGTPTAPAADVLIAIQGTYFADLTDYQTGARIRVDTPPGTILPADKALLMDPAAQRADIVDWDLPTLAGIFDTTNNRVRANHWISFTPSTWALHPERGPGDLRQWPGRHAIDISAARPGSKIAVRARKGFAA